MKHQFSIKMVNKMSAEKTFADDIISARR